MAGVLGVATVSTCRTRFFNLLNPLIALGYAFTGFRIEHVPPTETDAVEHAAAIGPTDDRPTARRRPP